MDQPTETAAQRQVRESAEHVDHIRAARAAGRLIVDCGCPIDRYHSQRNAFLTRR